MQGERIDESLEERRGREEKKGEKEIKCTRNLIDSQWIR